MAAARADLRGVEALLTAVASSGELKMCAPSSFATEVMCVGPFFFLAGRPCGEVARVRERGITAELTTGGRGGWC